MKNRIIYIAAALFLLLAGFAIAQEDEGTPPAQAGPYRFGGNVSAGYRTTTVTGIEGRNSDIWAERLFHEQFQYDPTEGIPVIDLNLYGEKPIGGEGFFDQLFLNGSYDGDNILGSLRMREFGSYDFKVSYIRSSYFFDRFDSIFSDLHQYDQSRDRINASLTVTPIDMLDINVQYFGTGRTGTQQIPRTPFIEIPGSFGSWGGYGRANIFLMTNDINDWTSRFQGSLTAHLPMTSVTAGGGYMNFSQDIDQNPFMLTSLNNIGDSASGFVNEFGIIGTSTVKEPLKDVNWLEKRESSGPFAFGQVVFKPIDMLTATASVNYQKVEQTATADITQIGTVRINNAGSQLRDYRATYIGGSDGHIDQLNASLMLALRPIAGLQVLGGYQMQTSKQTTEAAFSTTLDTAARGTEINPIFVSTLADSITPFDAETEYDVPIHSIVGQVVYAPLPNLSVRGGVRLAIRSPEVTRHLEGELDSAYSADLSEKTTTTTMTFNVFYRPIEDIRLRARVENTNREAELDNPTSLLMRNDAADPTLTPRRTPENKLLVGGSVDATIMDGLTLSLGGETSSGDNPLTPFSTGTATVTTTNIPFELKHSSTSMNAGLSYRLDEWMELSITGDYSERDFSIPSTWTRGTLLANPPFGNSSIDSLTVLIEEHTIDRFLGITASVNPIDDLMISAGFNYLSSSGGSSMSPGLATAPNSPGDVTKLNGPYTRWEARGQVQYYFLPNLGIGVNALFATQEDDQTAYYVALNNFKASAFTFSLLARL